MFKWITRFFKRNKPGSPEAIAAKAETFTQGFQRLKLEHFTAREFLTMGAGHFDSRSPGYGLNTHPPRVLWAKIYKLARVMDKIREEVGAPIQLHSVFRNDRYNLAIGGAPLSQHKLGQAADISSPRRTALHLWRHAVRERNDGTFEGGIGLYDDFVHVDIRGSRANWDRRK